MKRLIAGTASALLALPLSAQPTRPAPDEDTRALPAVTVSGERGVATPLVQPSTAASRLNLSPLETPASVSVVPAELVRSLGVGTLIEAKTLAPGISSAPNPGNGGNLLNARGFTGQNSVKQLYNGLEIYNAGGVVSFPFDPWNIERIEVMGGPASVLYGTGAIGGAVNVVSKQPDASRTRHEVALGAGSYRALHQAVGSTGPLAPGWSYRLDLSHRGANNWIPRGESETLALSAALRWDASARLRLTLRTDYGEQSPMHYLGTPLANGAVAPGTRLQNYNISDNDLYFQDRWLTLQTNWDPTDNVTVRSDVYNLNHRRRYRDIQTFTYVPATGVQSAAVRRTGYRDIAHSLQRQNGINTYAKVNGQLLGMTNEFLAGFQVNQGSYDRHDNVRAGTSLVDALNPVPGLYRDAYRGESLPQYYLQLNQLGLYLENRLVVNDQFSVVAGLRSDRYRTQRLDRVTNNSTEGKLSGLSGNVGLVFNPEPEWAVYGQLATASDPVNSLASIGANQQGFGLSKGRQVEIGVKQSLWNGKRDWTLAAYRIVKKDLLTANLANPTIQEQVGQQSSRGIEAAVSARLSTWRIEANGTVVDPKFDDFKAQVGTVTRQLAGNVPTTVHRRAANLLVFWQFAPGWTARSALQYVGQRFTDNLNVSSMPGYTTLNLGLNWVPVPQLSVDLRLDNATDKVYATQGSATQWILGRPRTITLSGFYAF